MDAHPPGDVLAAVGADGMAAPGRPGRPGRLLITVMLIAAATLDLTRCGIVLMTARHAGPAAGLVAAGVAAAALTLSTARGCQNGRRWSGRATLLIGVASAPQAAASGFHAPYAIPDTATAALGILLTVAVLAAIGQSAGPDPYAGNLCSWTGGSPDDRLTGKPPGDRTPPL
jgi:hypothetical protein